MSELSYLCKKTYSFIVIIWAYWVHIYKEQIFQLVVTNFWKTVQKVLSHILIVLQVVGTAPGVSPVSSDQIWVQQPQNLGSGLENIQSQNPNYKRTAIWLITELKKVILRRNGLMKQVTDVKERPLELESEGANGKEPGGGKGKE